YNSNPTAMERAIELLRGATPSGRRILATGDMLELGPYAPRAHARVGELSLAAGIDLLVAVGPLSAKAVEAARRGAARKGGVTMALEQFEDSAAAGAWLAAEVRPGDLVLVKGSRGIRMERVVDALLGRTAAAGGGAH
ncbi:MAG TPA: UDP-N-acetylmuramoylalanyl-D-glutamyl-2, 6-diaminopimelate--D-alanyl-D-alanine ligase, partial [Dongiaceae bacterium]|nr:UDP-N-acetylmuramoylalanyl-D-glutamyl-2, 6-diaminopimelate--D-alanyl-D-alanine ligase [Dongiaceae bacterium]